MPSRDYHACPGREVAQLRCRAVGRALGACQHWNRGLRVQEATAEEVPADCDHAGAGPPEAVLLWRAQAAHGYAALPLQQTCTCHCNFSSRVNDHGDTREYMMGMQAALHVSVCRSWPGGVNASLLGDRVWMLCSGQKSMAIALLCHHTAADLSMIADEQNTHQSSSADCCRGNAVW